MDITISVSERICEMAQQNGQDIIEFVEEVLEEKEKQFAISHGENRERKHSLLKFAGMFSGGDGKTSENYKQILRDEIDSVAGFTTDKKN